MRNPNRYASLWPMRGINQTSKNQAKTNGLNGHTLATLPIEVIEQELLRRAITPKRGSGRRAGSFCFLRLSWQQLAQYMGDASDVLVSRKWAEALGIAYPSTGPANKLHRSVHYTK